MTRNSIRRRYDAEYTDLNEVLRIAKQFPDVTVTATSQPTQMLLDGKPYTDSDSTDVQKTWRKHGWTPPSETAKFKNRIKGG